MECNLASPPRVTSLVLDGMGVAGQLPDSVGTRFGFWPTWI